MNSFANKIISTFFFFTNCPQWQPHQLTLHIFNFLFSIFISQYVGAWSSFFITVNKMQGLAT